MRRIIPSLFIMLATIAFARIIASAVAVGIEPTPFVPLRAHEPFATRTSTLDRIRVASIYGIGHSAPLPPEQPVLPSSSHLRLRAMIVSDRPALSTALVMDAAHFASLVRIGDTIGHITVEEISRDPFQVIVMNHATGRLESITGEDVANLASPGVRQIDPTHRTIDRAAFESAITDLPSLAKDVRVTPLTRGGRSLGWQIAALNPESVLGSLGLRPGDVLLRVNGLDLDAPEKALEAWQRLRNAVVFDLDVERSGAPVRLSYRIGN